MRGLRQPAASPFAVAVVMVPLLVRFHNRHQDGDVAHAVPIGRSIAVPGGEVNNAGCQSVRGEGDRGGDGGKGGRPG